MANSNEYMNNYMKARYKRRRENALQQLGGKCSSCDGTIDLDIHHKDPATKSFTLASGSSYSEERWQAELAKCELLCRTCHTAEHTSKYPCGTPQRYWRGCKCEACKNANSAYSREYKRRRSLTKET